MSEEYECCASGYCEVCRGAQGLIRSLARGGESDDMPRSIFEAEAGTATKELADRDPLIWDDLGVDDGGMPIHLPIGVNAAGQGPHCDCEECG